MNEIEIGVLEACQEYVARQREMLPALADAIGVEPPQVFYSWMKRGITQRGTLADSDWRYFFHGYECDLTNQADGRCLRMDFGPNGRTGVLDRGGVLAFTMTAVSPWKEFPGLRTCLAKNGPPYDRYSGDWEKMSLVWQGLESRGFFEQANPDLVALLENYTTRGANGLKCLTFPADVPDETQADCKVAHRQQLSRIAHQFLKSRVSPNGANPCEPNRLMETIK